MRKLKLKKETVEYENNGGAGKKGIVIIMAAALICTLLPVGVLATVHDTMNQTEQSVMNLEENAEQASNQQAKPPAEEQPAEE